MAGGNCVMQACRTQIQAKTAVLRLNSTGQRAGTQMGFFFFHAVVWEEIVATLGNAGLCSYSLQLTG